jgi:hypothetical protein
LWALETDVTLVSITTLLAVKALIACDFGTLKPDFALLTLVALSTSLCVFNTLEALRSIFAIFASASTAARFSTMTTTN